MISPTRRVLVCLAVFVFGLTTLPGVLAQTEGGREFQIKKIRQQARKAPDYGGSGTSLGGQSSWANKPWLHIEVEFDSDPEWADDVQLKYYVLMGQGRELQMFSGQLTHINVAKGSRHYSAMFVHPATLARFGQNKVEAVAVQLYYKGRLADMASDPNVGRRWWEQFSPVEGYLLAPEDTPWSVIAFQKYEAAKPSAAR